MQVGLCTALNSITRSGGLDGAQLGSGRLSGRLSNLDSSDPPFPFMVLPPGIANGAISLLLGCRRLRPYLPFVLLFVIQFPIRWFGVLLASSPV
jgi:hypothetical protein